MYESFIAALPSIISTAVIGVACYLGGKLRESYKQRQAEKDQQAELLADMKEIKAYIAEDKILKQAIIQGLKAELRESIVDAYGRYVVDDEPLTVERMHQLTEIHEAYVGIGGNGTGSKMFGAIQEKQVTIVHGGLV